MLDLSSLRGAFDELQRAYAKSCSPEIGKDSEMFGFLRSAVVHDFEFTYELSIKFMRRFLEMFGSEQKESVDGLTFRSLLRVSRENGLIADIEPWLLFRDKRNITSHTYDSAKADEVFSVIPAFLDEIRVLLEMLESKTKAEP